MKVTKKIFDDKIADRLWRMIYNKMDIKKPNFEIEFRENRETGLPLFGTGIILVRNECLNTINKRYVMMCA